MTIFNPLILIPHIAVNLILYFFLGGDWYWYLIGNFFFIWVLRETPAQRKQRIIDEVKKESEKRRKERNN